MFDPFGEMPEPWTTRDMARRLQYPPPLDARVLFVVIWGGEVSIVCATPPAPPPAPPVS